MAGGDGFPTESSREADKNLRLQLILADGSTYAHEGTVYFADRQVNESTGAIRIAGLFPNPGQYFKSRRLCQSARRDPDRKRRRCLFPSARFPSCRAAIRLPSSMRDNKVDVFERSRWATAWVTDGLLPDGLNPGDRVVAEGSRNAPWYARESQAVLRPNQGAASDRLDTHVKILHQPTDRGHGDFHRPGAGWRLTILSLPVAQFPNIAPPEIQILATYVGADAQTLEQAVATPLEQQMNGVDNMNYMYSLNATGNSTTSLIVDFDVKTDPNTDFILTQSRETQAASQLPVDVTNYGVTVRKSVTAPLMWVALYSPHGTYDAKFLANYAYINLTDPILRSPGIGNVQVFGAGQYAMRLWVKPDTLAKLGITVPEIVSAIQSQNTVNPAGKAGGEPAPKGQEFTYSVLAQGRLVSPEEFGNIVVRETPDGGTVRVRDVARIELGAQDYSVAGRFNGKPSAIVAAYQLPGSNAVDAAAGVKKLMAQMKERFPEDMDFAVSLDTTLSVTQGIKEIVWTLLIALVLVILVVFHFLARLARHADPAAGCASFACRNVRAVPAVRFFHQHAFSFWSGAGDRPGGR